jgi:hypothetical protein
MRNHNVDSCEFIYFVSHGTTGYRRMIVIREHIAYPHIYLVGWFDGFGLLLVGCGSAITALPCHDLVQGGVLVYVRKQQLPAAIQT